MPPPPDESRAYARSITFELTIAGVLALAAVAAAFVGPALHPLAGKDGQPLAIELQRAFTTAWAAIVATTPALVTLWFRRTSPRAAAWWLAFWTASCAVYLVHFVTAVVFFFHNDWSRILHSEFVRLPRLDTVLTVWWVLDVVLAWTLRTEGVLVRAQRVTVHVLLMVLFILGSNKEGGHLLPRVLGLAMGVSAVGALGLAWFRRWATRRVTSAGAR